MHRASALFVGSSDGFLDAERAGGADGRAEPRVRVSREMSARPRIVNDDEIGCVSHRRGRGNRRRRSDRGDGRQVLATFRQTNDGDVSVSGGGGVT
jgi:hypothetical protein